MMEKAAALLGIDLTGDIDGDWLTLARVLIREVHPGGEAGRVLEDSSGYKPCMN